MHGGLALKLIAVYLHRNSQIFIRIGSEYIYIYIKAIHVGKLYYFCKTNGIHYPSCERGISARTS